MKKVLKTLGVAALSLAVAAPALAATDVELWYGAAVTEAGPLPDNWVGYNIIKQKCDVNLKATALPSAEGDQNTKINAAGAANKLPDIFMVSSAVFDNLVKQKLLAEVDDMYKMMPNRTKTLYSKDAIAFTTVGKHSYGLAQPGSVIKNEGVLIRTDWLKKVGKQVPTTTAEFLDVMKAFTNNDPDGNGKADTYGYGGYLETSAPNEGLGRRFDPIFGAFGVAGTWNLSSAKTAGLNIHKPEYFEAMQYMKSIVDAKVIDPNWLSYKKDDFRGAWKQGRFGIMREQNAAYASESNYAPFDKNFPNGSWQVIAPPKGPKGLSSAGTYSQAYRIYCVAKKSASKKAAIAKLLEWMSSEEGYYLLGWGQKNVNYVLNAQGVPTVEGLADPSKGFSKSENQPLTQLRNMVYYNSNIELAARYPTYKTAVSGKTMSALTTLREMQKYNWTYAPGQDKMPKPTTDVERLYNQGVTEFMTGTRKLDKANWQKFIKEFDAQGGAQWEKDGIAFAKANRLVR
ncbi:extracellular solute-binding protein [Treponema zioleckii]|uniref:extracellular solute-binding protein n=1 Tax=Treponema zioleckii TaxID=331680 RepID=UPI00168AF4B5|nr:extracellular solute-binding protein [Treponema zioleckii]